MPLSKIKKEFINKRVGFGNNADPLGKRTDIDHLAILAIESQDSSLLRLFETPMPSLADLKKAKTEVVLKRPVVVPPQEKPILKNQPLKSN